MRMVNLLTELRRVGQTHGIMIGQPFLMTDLRIAFHTI